MCMEWIIRRMTRNGDNWEERRWGRDEENREVRIQRVTKEPRVEEEK